ncbi:MAG: peptidylprolyl isomerase [Coriobacteriales bacterium]|nr:peptidylprolyl isomerase [Coriobacteriales bacterium]
MKKKIAVIVTLLACLLLCVCICACGEQKSHDAKKAPVSTDSNASYKKTVDKDDKYGSGTHHAVVKVKGYDEFTIELSANDAPVSVSNFCKLANDGFYDGLTFHRIVKDFCLQGGDPKGDGTGNSDQKIIGEFSSNNVTNKLADNYKEGVVAMARSNDKNSASCQWFVTLADSAATSLNGQYAAFGTIDAAGMKICQKIVSDYAGNVADQSSGTISDKSKQPVIESIKITD